MSLRKLAAEVLFEKPSSPLVSSGEDVTHIKHEGENISDSLPMLLANSLDAVDGDLR